MEQRLLDDANSAREVQAEIFRIEQRLAAIRSQETNTHRRVKEKSERVANLRTRLESLERTVSVERERFNRALHTRYMLWRQPAIKVFLNQENVHALSRNRYFYDHLMSTLRNDLQGALDELKTVGDLKTVLALETNRLKTLQFQATLEQQTLHEALQARGKIVQHLEIALGETESQVARLKNDESKLQSLLEKLNQAPLDTPNDSPAFGSLLGKLPWPARGKVVTAPGSAVRDGGAKWAGVLIQAPAGTEVRAIAGGRVAFADWFRNLGLLVIIDHQGGHMSLYGYNQELRVSSGDWVDQNDPIATVGDTGGRSASGLYFEIRSKGEPLDPRRWCAKLD